RAAGTGHLLACDTTAVSCHPGRRVPVLGPALGRPVRSVPPAVWRGSLITVAGYVGFAALWTWVFLGAAGRRSQRAAAAVCNAPDAACACALAWAPPCVWPLSGQTGMSTVS